MSDYPAGMTLRPIEHWPGAMTQDRKRSPFSAPWRSTLELLERELAHLSSDPRRLVAPAVLQIAMRGVCDTCQEAFGDMLITDGRRPLTDAEIAHRDAATRQAHRRQWEVMA